MITVHVHMFAIWCVDGVLLFVSLHVIKDEKDERFILPDIFPGAVPNNHTPPDDDIERNLCVELSRFHSHTSCELF